MFDLILLGIIAVSAVLGLFRGLLAMVLGMASWLVASWASWRFGDLASQWVAGGSAPELTHLLGGHVLVFLVVLVVFAVGGFVLRKLLETAQLTALDRLLGLAIGALRGILIASIIVLVAGFTPLAQGPAWQASVAVPLLSPFSNWMRMQLPVLAAAAVHDNDQSDMGKGAESGDNAPSNDIATDKD